MVDTQTEARVIAGEIENLAHRWANAAYHKALNMPFEDFEPIKAEMRDIVTTALAAKDAELAAAEHMLELSKATTEAVLERAERAEAELAATKADRDDWIDRCRASVMAFDEQKARAERAEAQLAGTRKMLDDIAALDNNNLHYGPEFARRILSALEQAAPEGGLLR